MSNYDNDDYLSELIFAYNRKEIFRKYDSIIHTIVLNSIGLVIILSMKFFRIMFYGIKDIIERMARNDMVNKIEVVSKFKHVIFAIIYLLYLYVFVWFASLFDVGGYVFLLNVLMVFCHGFRFMMIRNDMNKRFYNARFGNERGVPRLVSYRFRKGLKEYVFKTDIPSQYFKNLDIFDLGILDAYNMTNSKVRVITAIDEIIEELTKVEKIDFKDENLSILVRFKGLFDFLNLNMTNLKIKFSNQFSTLMYFNSTEPIAKMSSSTVIEEIKHRLKMNNISIETSDIQQYDYMIRIMSTNEVIRFNEVYNEVRPILYKYKLPFLLGMDDRGELVIIDYALRYNTIMAGTIRSGKTNTMKVCLSSILLANKNVMGIIIDTKKDMTAFKDLENIYYIDNIVEAMIALKWVLKEIKRRSTIFSQVGKSNIEEYNNSTGKNMPYMLLVIEELADLVMSSDSKLNKIFINDISRIAQIGGASGNKGFFNTQKPNNSVIGDLLKSSCPERFCHIVASATDSRVILDNSEGVNIKEKGTFIYKSGQDMGYYKAPLLDDLEAEKVKSELKELQKQRQIN